MKLRTSEWEVRRIRHADARAFMAANHYAQGAGNTSVYAHGLYKKGQLELLGAAVWLPPMRPAAQWVSRELGVNPDGVLCLSRLAIHECVPTNGASFLMGRASRQIKKDGNWSALVTWADDRLGHTGAIYKATNWTPAGTTKTLGACGLMPKADWSRRGRAVPTSAATSLRPSASSAAGPRPSPRTSTGSSSSFDSHHGDHHAHANEARPEHPDGQKHQPARDGFA